MQLLVEYNYNPSKRNNEHLLSHYGFVMKDNPCDSVTMQVSTTLMYAIKCLCINLLNLNFALASKVR